MMPTRVIDADRFAATLRARAVDLPSKRVLVSRYSGSLQATDLTLPANCGGVGRVHHFRQEQGPGWPRNPLPIEPAAHALGLAVSEEAQAQVFQIAICGWRCWYCFVDYGLLSGDRERGVFYSADDLLDLFLRENSDARIIDLSGGQPDVIPEWPLWFTQALKRRGVSTRFFLWSDDNLSNDYLWRYLTSADIRLLAENHHYARVGCFKGFDEQSFSFNTGADGADFRAQFSLMRRLIESGLDVYGYATLTSDDGSGMRGRVARFVDQLQERVHPLFPLRVVPLRIREFAPTRERVRRGRNRFARALCIQNEAVAAWSEELARRFDGAARGKRVFEHRVA